MLIKILLGFNLLFLWLDISTKASLEKIQLTTITIIRMLMLQYILTGDEGNE